MEPTWIFKKADGKYIPFSPDDNEGTRVLTKEEAEMLIMRRGSLAKLDFDEVVHSEIAVDLHDGMIKYQMTQALSAKLKAAMGNNKVITGKLKLTYTANRIANVLAYDIVLFQDAYLSRVEAEIIRLAWNNTIKAMIHSLCKRFPSTELTEADIYQALSMESKKYGGGR